MQLGYFSLFSEIKKVKNRTTKTKKINGWIALIHSFHIDRFDTCMKMIQHWRYNISLNYGLRCNCPKIQRFSNRESFWNLDQVSNEMSWIRILLIVYALRYGRDGCNYYVRYFQFRQFKNWRLHFWSFKIFFFGYYLFDCSNLNHVKHVLK